MCGLPIPGHIRSDARHCSIKCQQAAWYAANSERLKAAAREWNRRNPEQKAQASRAWYRANFQRVKAANNAWREANADKVREISRESSARRRARKAAVTVEDFTFEQIWLRDEGRCWLCGDDVDPSVAWPDSRSPSIDHVIPLALGGEHSLQNCSLSHLVCNLRKGVKLVAVSGPTDSEEESDAMAAKPA